MKYQILSKYTALYAEIEFPNKNTEEIKLIKLKQNDNIQIPLEFNFPPELNQMSKYLAKKDMKFEMRNDMMDGVLDSDSDSPENEEDINKILNSLGINNLDKETIKEKKEEELNLKNNNDLEECNKNEILNQKKNDNLNEKNIEDKKNKDKDNSNKKNDKKKNDLEYKKITDIGNDKKKIMEIINTQDFLDGFWCLNEKTNIIKELYKKEFELLKGLKNININDNIAITILIIYFIYDKHQELLQELIMIIKKGKLFIQNQTKINYEDIIKKIQKK